MHDEAAQGGATLPGSARSGERDAAHRQVERCRRGHDGCVVATEFEDGAAEAGGNHRGHLGAHRRGAGGADERHVVAGSQRRAHRRIAQHHLRQMRGCVDRRRCAVEHRLRGERGERGEVARLPDHAVAAHHGQCRVPAPHGDREVERGDDGHRSVGVPLLHQPVVGSFAGDGEAVQLTAQADGEVADVDHLLHLTQRLAADLARLELHQGGQVVLVAPQFLAEAAHQFAAHRPRHRAPRAEGSIGTFDGQVDLGRCGHTAQRRAGDGRAGGVWPRAEGCCTAGDECSVGERAEVGGGGQGHAAMMPARRVSSCGRWRARTRHALG